VDITSQRQKEMETEEQLHLESLKSNRGWALRPEQPKDLGMPSSGFVQEENPCEHTLGGHPTPCTNPSCVQPAWCCY